MQDHLIIAMLIMTNRKITGSLQFSRPQWILGWIPTTAMVSVAIGMLTDLAFG